MTTVSNDLSKSFIIIFQNGGSKDDIDDSYENDADDEMLIKNLILREVLRKR